MRKDSNYNLRHEKRRGRRWPAAGWFGLVLCCIFALITAGTLRAQGPPQNFKPKNYVTDFAKVLSPSGVTQLTALCAEVEQKTQAQIAVVTIKSLDGEAIEDY